MLHYLQLTFITLTTVTIFTLGNEASFPLAGRARGQSVIFWCLTQSVIIRP